MSSMFVDVFALVGTGWTRSIILLVLLGGLWVGLTRAGLQQRQRMLVWLSVTLPLLVWLFIVTELAQAGIFLPGALGRLPAIPLAVLLPIAIALPLLIRSKHITAMIDA